MLVGDSEELYELALSGQQTEDLTTIRGRDGVVFHSFERWYLSNALLQSEEEMFRTLSELDLW